MDALQKNIPDGGWGWVVVGAVALINMTNQSILSVFGLLFGGQLNGTMHKDTFTASLITNLNSVALNFSGLFVGPVIKHFKPRNVASIGCVMVSLGLMVCSFATESWHFIVGYSFLVGMGLGLIAPSTFMAINSYFTTKRGRAVGCSLAGAGVGQVFIPHLVRFLLDNYGFQPAVLAMSLLSLTGLFGAALLKPLKVLHNNREHIQILLRKDGEKKHPQEYAIQILPEAGNGVALKADSTLKKFLHKITHRFVQAMDLSLLTDATFLSIIIGMAVVYTSTINFTMIFPSFLRNAANLSSSQTASCMSIMAGADIVCRLLLPCITDKLHIPYRMVFLLGTIGLTLSRAALAESHDMTSVIVLSIFTGMTKSATVINNNLTISGHCSAEKLAGGLGLNMLSKGIIVITVGQLLGWVRDYSKSYVICLHAQNVLLLLVIIVWSSEILYRYWQQRKAKLSGNEKFIETTKDSLKIVTNP